MKSEPIHIPVITHTNSLVSLTNLGLLTLECYDNLYGSKSDSEKSDLSVEIHGSSLLDRKSPKEIPLECRWIECGKTFKHLDDLAAHVTSLHANSGPGGLFFCGWEGCSRGNRGFNARYKMLVHVRTHTNEKPHHCFQCDKSFSRAENLKIHARSHTGERPYVCPVPGCGKAYSNSSDRFKHTRTHSVDKPYVCKLPGCGKKYTDPSSLRKHVKTYRHFVTNLGTEVIQIKDSPSNFKLEYELDCDQIVPQSDKMDASPTKRLCVDSTNVNCYYYYYDVESNEKLNYHRLNSWFKTEHLRYYQDHAENWGKYYQRLQEQEMPLDLTTNK